MNMHHVITIVIVNVAVVRIMNANRQCWREKLGTKRNGNNLGVLPFTVIVDRKGKIIHRLRKELTFEAVEDMIKPLL